ncbi:magnesium transporter [Calditrichota bacterium]
MTRMIAETDLTDILTDITQLIESNNQGALSNILIDLHPADIAFLISQLKKDDRKYLFNLLPTETGSDVITELDPPIVEHLLSDISEKEISELVEEMDSDDAADIISDLPDDVADRVLDQVTDEVSEEVKELLTYEEDTAGGIMALEFVSVGENSTVTEAIEAIRIAKEDMDSIYSIWVVDNNNRLTGSVSLTDLVLAHGKTSIQKIMTPDLHWVTTDVDQEEVAIMFRKYDLVALPVVNILNQLVGEITVDDIVDVLDEEIDEDISMMAGTNDEEIQEESFLKISWVRLPWLVIAFFGQIIAAFVIKSYEVSLQQVIALTFFMPVIMAMGGNSGIQSSTIVIRGLATGEISLSNTKRRFFRELRVSLFIGLIFGISMAVIVGLWFNPIMGLMVGVALNLVILQASLFGGIIPFILKRANIDPALASGPFITTFNDILGLLIYLIILTVTIPMYV